MHAAALLRLIRSAVLVAVALALLGCSTAAKRHYLRHLSLSVSPDDREAEIVAAFSNERSEIIAAETPAFGDESP